MSHFTVLVIGGNTPEKIAELLDPFEEQTDTDPALDPRFEFQMEHNQREALALFEEYKSKCPSQEQIDEAFNFFFNEVSEEDHYKVGLGDNRDFDVDFSCGKRKFFRLKDGLTEEDFEKWCNEKGLEKFYVRQQMKADKYPDVRTYMEDYGHGHWNEDHQGYGFFSNPKAKWDWWQIGGRWTGYFIPKQGAEFYLGRPGVFNNECPNGHCDVVQIKNIDFEAMRKESEEATLRYWKEAEGKSVGERHFGYGIKEDDTFETYLKRQSSPSTFAVVKDGEWYEKGEMGWWACVSNEKDQDRWEEEFNKLLSDLDPETWVAVVDCHI